MFCIFTTVKVLAKTYEANFYMEDFDDQSPWYHMLCRQTIIFATDYNPIFTDDGVIDELDFSDSTLAYKFGESTGIEIINSDAIIAEILKDNSRVLEFPGAAYYLEITKEEAKRISNAYGVICYSAIDDPSLKEYCKSLPYKLEKGEVGLQWEDICKYPKKLPINSLCITDRNLFSWDGFGDNGQFVDKPRTNGMDNLEEILRQLLPSTLDAEFHLSLFVEQNRIQGLSFEMLSESFFAIVNKVKKDRKIDYGIIAQIVAWRGNENKKGTAKYSDEITHERRVYSNYFIVEAGQGLNAIRFYGSKKGAGNYDQTIKMDYLYSSDILDIKEVSSSEAILRGLQKAVRNKWLPHWKENPNSNDYWIASNIPPQKEKYGVEDFKNRLFL